MTLPVCAVVHFLIFVTMVRCVASSSNADNWSSAFTQFSPSQTSA